MQSSKPRKNLPPIVFLGGKGGVGKTTLAAGMALGLAGAGEETLLVSTDPAHSLSDLLDRPLGNRPRQVMANLYACELDPEQARDDYLATVRENIRRFTQPEFLVEAERQVNLAGRHPGVMESALFEALCRLLDEAPAPDRIVVDTAPTGHTLHLLTLPESMRGWTDALLARQSSNETGQGGPAETRRWQQARDVLEARRALFERTRERLTDPDRSAFLLVVNDDRLSVREGERARATLQEAGVSIPALLVNRAERDTAAITTALQATFPNLPIHCLPALTPPPQGLDGLEPLVTHLRDHGLPR